MRGREALLERLGRLSAREREVMVHVVRGRLNKQIAADLDIALQTVKQHRGRVMEKMQVRSVAELVHACEAAGNLPGRIAG
jgi:FixJ family two-component response regulator